MQDARFKNQELQNELLGSPCKLADLAWEMKGIEFLGQLTFQKIKTLKKLKNKNPNNIHL